MFLRVLSFTILLLLTTISVVGQSNPTFESKAETFSAINQTIGKLQINSSILVSTKSSETPPTTYSLNQNSPNPFNPTTIISYSLLKSGMVTINIYDITGRFITTLVNGVKRAGAHTVQFEGSTLSSGIYVYTLESNGYRQSRQMILMK